MLLVDESQCAKLVPDEYCSPWRSVVELLISLRKAMHLYMVRVARSRRCPDVKRIVGPQNSLAVAHDNEYRLEPAFAIPKGLQVAW